METAERHKRLASMVGVYVAQYMLKRLNTIEDIAAAHPKKPVVVNVKCEFSESEIALSFDLDAPEEKRNIPMTMVEGQMSLLEEDRQVETAATDLEDELEPGEGEPEEDEAPTPPARNTRGRKKAPAKSKASAKKAPARPRRPRRPAPQPDYEDVADRASDPGDEPDADGNGTPVGTDPFEGLDLPPGVGDLDV